MSFSVAAVVSLFCAGSVAAQFYTLGGYACSQPALYTQCQCPSFCGAYGGGYAGNNGFPDYQTWSQRHPHRRRHHKKKKFRFETLEELESTELPTNSPTSAPRGSTHTWEDEDLWEKKFVNPKSKGKISEGISEELPEIDSSEIAAARARLRGKGEEAEFSEAAASRPASAARPSGGSGGGGVGVGSGVGVGGIGVSSGLGVGAPGIGGLGGGGGLFGISSGVGVGVPGVGPIGISSGLGIGR